jgi:hypothetical protein
MKTRGWFGPKRVGWGISPRTWQGWLVTAIYVLVIAVGLPIFPPGGKLIVIGAGTVAFFAVMFATYSKDEPADEA